MLFASRFAVRRKPHDGLSEEWKPKTQLRGENKDTGTDSRF